MTNLRTARLLMIVTLLLLTAFQVYWLNKLYNEEYTSIQRNTNVLFKECLYKLQVERFKKDTLYGKLPGENLFTIDMVNILKSRMEDTTSVNSQSKKKIIISINSHFDTMGSDGHPELDSSKGKFMIRRKGDGPDFIRTLHDSLRLYDSLPLATIDSAYHKSLSDAKLDLSYSISKIEIKKGDHCNGSFCTSVIPMGLFGLVGYQASFSQPFFRLLKSIGPQILLSFLMIGLTVLSFIFIYRNLVQQKRLADIKNEFISNITHELKTPISTVSVAIEAIKNFSAANNPERTSEYLDIADKELQRLTMLVDKVLKLSMFEQDQVDLKFEVLDLKALVNEVLTTMKLQFEKYKAIVSMDAGNDGYLILADRTHLSGVLYNLLDNALKYSIELPQIKISMLKQQGEIVLSIADNGKGIPPELKDKVFEKFFRVPHGDSHDARGYGLGLSYVKHVISQHKGSISLESELGKGSTFIINLPAQNG